MLAAAWGGLARSQVVPRAELRALQAALWLARLLGCRGATIWTDHLALCTRWGQGLANRRAWANADLWDRVADEAAGAGGVPPLLHVPSHVLDEGPAGKAKEVKAHVTKQALVGNALADLLAGRAAHGSAVDQAWEMMASDWQNLAVMLGNRAVEILPGSLQGVGDQDVPRQPQPRTSLVQLRAVSEHMVVRLGVNGWRCRRCWGRTPPSGSQRGWWGSACPGRPGDDLVARAHRGAHASHALEQHAVVEDGTLFLACGNCYQFGSTARLCGLARPCNRPNGPVELFLRVSIGRLRRGLAPLRRGGVPRARGAVELELVAG